MESIDHNDTFISKEKTGLSKRIAAEEMAAKREEELTANAPAPKSVEKPTNNFAKRKEDIDKILGKKNFMPETNE